MTAKDTTRLVHRLEGYAQQAEEAGRINAAASLREIARKVASGEMDAGAASVRAAKLKS